MAKRKQGAESALERRIVEVFADFEKYLPSPQDVHLYRRKVKEYAELVLSVTEADVGQGQEAGDGNDD